MMNFLDTILSRKREEISEGKKAMSLSQLRDRPFFSLPNRSLAAALRHNGLAIIAEIKKASPSKGVLRVQFDHKQIARQFVDAGAKALSILTDEEFFQGHRWYLEDLRQSVPIPLLRKDFIIDSYQLYESKAFGADAVLLIAAALDPGNLAELLHEAEEIGLECLVEVHSEKEIDALAGINAHLFGVNNRNLSTFETDLNISVGLRNRLPATAVAVSESGINSVDDLRLLADHGYDAVLIGETLMKSEDPGDALRLLIDGIEER
ncbi:MAG TPA: indole-3-glycerol phosphate synthase TrpC [Bacteroidota bacterium]